MGSRSKGSLFRMTRGVAFVLIVLLAFPGSNGALAFEQGRKPLSALPPMRNFMQVEGLERQVPASKMKQPLIEAIADRQSSGVCSGLGVITRKSVTDLSDTEWNRYVAAFNRMKERNTSRGINVYERFSEIHLDHALHRQAAFLPWHREMLWRWDRALARGTPRGQPPARQPYYEWAAFPNNPFVGAVSSSDRYGGNGRVGGAFGNLISNLPSRHRVSRAYANSVVLTSSRAMNLLRSRVADFERFRVTLEGNHDAFHVRVGGDMVRFESPNDPYFYAHHAYIDKIYREWETAGNRVQTGVNLSLRMQPWSTTAAQAIARGRCVQYEGSRLAFSTAPDESRSGRRNTAIAAAKTAEDAARQFGASEAEIELARKTREELLLEEGIDRSDED